MGLNDHRLLSRLDVGSLVAGYGHSRVGYREADSDGTPLTVLLIINRPKATGVVFFFPQSVVVVASHVSGVLLPSPRSCCLWFHLSDTV